MKTYVYTKYGEEKSLEYGITYRKEGSIATLGFKQLQDSFPPFAAEEWEEEGFVKPIEISDYQYTAINEKLSEYKRNMEMIPIFPI